MHRPKMTREEFDKQYMQRNGFRSIEHLEEAGLVSVPCECLWEGCPGWEMVHKSYAEGRFDFVPRRGLK